MIIPIMLGEQRKRCRVKTTHKRISNSCLSASQRSSEMGLKTVLISLYVVQKCVAPHLSFSPPYKVIKDKEIPLGNKRYDLTCIQNTNHVS